MSRRPARLPSQRQLRVAEEIRHALATVIQRGELRDPATTGSAITVSEVRLSPDMRLATVFVSPLGGGDPAAAVTALTRARSYLRRRIGAMVRLKYVPDLSIRADEAFDEAQRIERLLRDPIVAQDLSRPPDSEEAEPGKDPDDGK